ncbi:MAG: hypothetical protein ABFR32_07220 [Bacteroidota bacterium]
MKKLIFIILFLSLFSCSSNDFDDQSLLPNVPVNETVFLNNPEYINLQVVGGWAYAQGGISGIIIYHMSTNNYIAFERSAPHFTPQACSKMVVKNSMIMVCSCDDSEFNIINGAPLTDGVKFAARQYRAVLVGNNTLQITNF